MIRSSNNDHYVIKGCLCSAMEFISSLILKPEQTNINSHFIIHNGETCTKLFQITVKLLLAKNYNNIVFAVAQDYRFVKKRKAPGRLKFGGGAGSNQFYCFRHCCWLQNVPKQSRQSTYLNVCFDSIHILFWKNKKQFKKSFRPLPIVSFFIFN